MWLNRVFIDLANREKYYCLTIDCSGVNKNDPGRYRLKLMILKSKFAILTNRVMMSYKMCS